MSVIEKELNDFQEFVRDAVRHESSDLQLEDYVCLWRARHERDETIAAIRKGFEDVDAGRVRPAKEVIAEHRARLG